MSACRECNAPVAGGVERCAIHRRPAFFSGRSADDVAWKRAVSDSQWPGESRRQFTRASESVHAQVRAELRRRGKATSAEISAAIGVPRDIVASALVKAVYAGAAWKRKEPRGAVQYHAIGGTP